MILHEERLDSTNAMEIFAQYDLIVDGTDNFATRYLVNDAVRAARQALRLGLDLPLRRPGLVFWAEHGPCYRCLYPEPPPPGMVPSCAEGGVLGVLCASIGSIQVTEAIKLLTGIGEPLVGRLMIYDALEMTYRQVKVRKDPECAVCGKNPTVTELIDYEAFCGAVSEEAAEAAAGSTITAKRAQGDAGRGEDIQLDRRPRAERVRDRQHPRRHADPEGRVPDRAPPSSSSPQDKRDRAALQERRPRQREALAVVQAAGFSGRGARRRRGAGLGEPDRAGEAELLMLMAGAADWPVR